MKKNLIYAVLAGITLLFASCASSLPVDFERPAELNLNGANSISILPFQTSGYHHKESINILGILKIKFDSAKANPEEYAANYLTTNLTSEILNSGFLNVISSKKVEIALENNNPIPCDVYLTGYTSGFYERMHSRYDKEEECTYYYREVRLNVVYEIIDAQTDKVLGVKSYNIQTESNEYEFRSYVPSTPDMLSSQLPQVVRLIMHDLQPYTITKSLTLLDGKPKTDDMKYAKKLAKARYFDEAYEIYTKVYEETGMYQAGYNAAIILEAMGDLDGAEALMEDVYIHSMQKRAESALKDIRLEQSYSNKLDEQLSLKKISNPSEN